MLNEVGGCLIIVDTDVLFIDKVQSLSFKEVSIFVASTPQAALSLLNEHLDQKLLIVCDESLVDEAGQSLCKRIKREASQAFVVLTKNSFDEESQVLGLKVGADMLLDKSASDEVLGLVFSNLKRTLLEEHEVPSVAHIDTIYSDIEEDVRRLVEVYYQLEPAQRMGQHCNSESIAEQLGFSIRTFQREIKAKTGYTFKQLQLVVRLDLAQELFAEGYNVNQVADLLAFSSPAHFSRSFKDEFGIAPSSYKRQLY